MRFKAVFTFVIALTCIITPNAMGGIAVAAKSSSNYTAEVNGLSISNPIVQTGQLNIPIREMADALRWKLSWDQVSKIATLTGGGFNVKMKAGERKIIVNDKEVSTGGTVRVIDGVTYLPARAFTQAIGGTLLLQGKLVKIEIPEYLTKSFGDVTFKLNKKNGDLFIAKGNNLKKGR
ncbi:copper amine oxidase N-terminal domain-containing protein [Paenibacillus thermotolerans]|uniref:copper amine oxidase N-terminal domain-containing protein n=1 Tax=Paenibacillus thermotolerans TaxID=3027807 RepID=UPI002368579D|nr:MULTISPECIES: copper amine oxidase N-terminal domain-containing protein [unclassified Paenibacillus]